METRAHAHAVKVGYLLKKFPRLSETFVLGELLEQEALGTNLHVFSRRPADDEPRHPELQQLRAQVEYLPHPRRVDPFSLLLRRHGLLARLESVLVELRPLDIDRLTSLVTEALHLVERCRDLGIQHLHVHFATESCIVALIASKLGGPTYSFTAHAKDIYRETVRPELLEALVIGSVFCVTVCNANVEHMAGKISPSAQARVRRHYNGIERATFDPSVRRPVAGRILSIGRLVEKKGFDILIDALAALRRQGADFSAEIIGDGDRRDDLEQQIRSLGLESQVRLLGPVDAGQVRARLAEASLFCLPCRIGNDGNRDALPTVLLEAQAAGIPIVSTPVTGIPEILDQGRAGVLVPEDDACATAVAMKRLLNDPRAGRVLATRGCEHGAKNFDRGAQGATLQTWFEDALQQRRDACVSQA